MKDVNHTANRLWTKNYILVILSTLGISFGNFFFSSTLPIYAERISGSAAWAGAMTGIYTLSALASRPVAGELTDRIGRARLAVIAAAICIISCLLYNIAIAILLLLIFRIVHGFAFGLHSTAISTAAVDVIPENKRMEGIGYLGMFNTLASAVAPGFALSLVQSNENGFTILFFMAGGTAAVSFVAGLFIGYEKKGIRHTDIHEEFNVKEKDKTKTILGLEPAAFKPALVLFIICLAQSSVGSFIVLSSMSKGLGNVGLFFTLSACSAFCSTLIAVKLGDKYGASIVLIPGMILTAASLLLLPLASTNTFLILIGIPYGVAQGMILPILNVIVINLAPKEHYGAANSTYFAALDTGFGLGSIAWGFIASFMGSYNGIYYLAAVLPLVAVLVYIKFVRHSVSKSICLANYNSN
jgi:MFS family permease